MQQQNVDQSPNSRLNKCQPWKICLGSLSVAVLMSLALAPAVLNHLVPKVPDRAQGVTARMGWYLHSGQLQADIRTLAATFQYVISTEPDDPTATECAKPPVAENAAPSSPKS